jgi:hypothetical protein
MCDFNTYPKREMELHRNFLLKCFDKVIANLETADDFELCLLHEVLIRLEEQSITGIYWLNKAFMMWVLGQVNEQRTNKIIMMTQPVPFDFTIEKLAGHLANGKLRSTEIRHFDIPTLKEEFIQFMAGKKVGLAREVEEMRKHELQIIEFQDAMKREYGVRLMGLDEKNISNTGHVFMIQIELAKRDSEKVRQIKRDIQTYYL